MSQRDYNEGEDLTTFPKWFMFMIFLLASMALVLLF